MTLDPAELAGEGIRYAAQERRHHRLTISPLPLVDGRLLVMPWRILAAQNTYASYLEDGRLPWHPDDLPENVANAFGRYRQIGNRALERAALAEASALGLPGSMNVTPETAERKGMTIGGEIDVLIADPERQRLWVCEVKDLYAATSPQTIQTRIAKFTDPDDGFAGRLLTRRDEVAEQATRALALVEVSGTVDQWRVIPLMITRRVEPAAFVADVGVPFVVLADLAAALTAPTEPANGQFEIGAT